MISSLALSPNLSHNPSLPAQAGIQAHNLFTSLLEIVRAFRVFDRADTDEIFVAPEYAPAQVRTDFSRTDGCTCAR
jgi:hypothetical protein